MDYFEDVFPINYCKHGEIIAILVYQRVIEKDGRSPKCKNTSGERCGECGDVLVLKTPRLVLSSLEETSSIG